MTQRDKTVHKYKIIVTHEGVPTLLRFYHDQNGDYHCTLDEKTAEKVKCAFPRNWEYELEHHTGGSPWEAAVEFIRHKLFHNPGTKVEILLSATEWVEITTTTTPVRKEYNK